MHKNVANPVHFAQNYIASHSSHFHDEGGSRNNSSSIRQKEKRGEGVNNPSLPDLPFSRHPPSKVIHHAKIVVRERETAVQIVYFSTPLSPLFCANLLSPFGIGEDIIRYRMNHDKLIMVHKYVYSGMTCKHNCFSCFFHSGKECSVHFIAAHAIFCYTFPCFSAFSLL